jgi:hypothetical protein
MNVWKPIALVLAAGLATSIGIQTASANKNPAPEPSTLSGPCFDQHNMADAKTHLNEALTSLGKAEHNKGGWRDNAVTATNNAIGFVNTGCASANGH